MKISVVIPTYNRPDFLLEAARSIAAQTHLNWEVVIVDDGSSPAIPLDQLNSQLGDNVILIRHDKSRGVACAKNAGIESATGEIITLLDDDDLLAPSALEKLDDAFTRRPDLDCVFLGVEPFGPYSANPAENRKKAIDKIIQRVHPIEPDGLYLFDENLFSELLYSVPIDFQRPAARRGAWNIVGGFDESGIFSESNWAIKASTVCKVALTKEPLTYWRIHGNNFGWPSGLDHDQALLRQMNNDLESVQALVRDFCCKQAEMASQVKCLKARLAESCFNKAYFLQDKNKLLGFRTLLRSIEICPQVKHFKLLLRYFLPGTKSSSKATGT